VASGPRSGAAQRGLVLDAGAFVAIERRDGFVAKLLARLIRANTSLVTSGGVVAQVWRGGTGRQAPVAMLLHQVTVIALDESDAKVVGQMIGVRGARDAVDGHVVLLARIRRWPVLTSDPGDLLAIDPGLEIVAF
jgi:hypothetical protein